MGLAGEGYVVGDAIKPGAFACVAAKCGEGTPDGEEDFLAATSP